MTAFNQISLMIIVASLLPNAKFKFAESLNVTRAAGDYFDNPDCDSNTYPRICSRYNAECTDNNECTRCYCRTAYALNFVGDGRYGGRCLTNNEVVKDSGKSIL